jgi:murein DD-endopeptidase MepM/ murein hydrolase activator NlpD
MSKAPYRILALGLFAAFGAAAAGQLVHRRPATAPSAAAPTLMPVAYANPAEVAFGDTLRKGESLSELLARSELAEAEAKALLAELSEHQNLRSLRPGAVVAYRKAFESGEVRAMEMRLDADRTLEVQKEGGGWKGKVVEVPVRTDTTVLAGEVTSSLYAALLASESTEVPAAERQAVADILADRIFAWQVDFSRDLRKGDRFRILYERQVRPDGTARSSRVLGVRFDVGGRERSAFLYRSPDGREDYYDAQGESLKRAFLRAPLEFRRISSAFSTGRFHPILKVSRPHHGIDYAASQGTPVRAVGDGVIAKAGWGGGYGNVIELRHQRGYSSRYAHLKGFAAGIRPGARVRQGDLIGYVGTTGLSTGPHLHYEFHQGGRPVDPNSIRSIPGEPVPGRLRTAYRAMVERQTLAMDRGAEVHFAALQPRPGAAVVE